MDPTIQFTLEHEHNGKVAFLDTVITRENGKLNIDVYRKPTHTDRYLDYNSHHQHKHKVSTARTLIRALTLPNTEERRDDELKYVKNALRANNYPLRTINNIITQSKSTHSPDSSPEELMGIRVCSSKWLNHQFNKST